MMFIQSFETTVINSGVNSIYGQPNILGPNTNSNFGQQLQQPSYSSSPSYSASPSYSSSHYPASPSSNSIIHNTNNGAGYAQPQQSFTNGAPVVNYGASNGFATPQVDVNNNNGGYSNGRGAGGGATSFTGVNSGSRLVNVGAQRIDRLC